MKDEALAQIASWFNNANYDCVSTFNLCQIANSLWLRRELFAMSAYLKKPDIIRAMFGHDLDLIFSGEIAKMAGDGSSPAGAFREWDAAPTKMLVARDFVDLSALITAQSPQESTLDRPPFDEWLTVDSLNYSKRIAIELDLAASDQDIIESIRTRLPAWREQLDCPEFNPSTNDGRSKGWSTWSDRFIKNRILQVCDVKLWGQVNGHSISDSTLSKIVYFDRDVGGSEGDIRKTHIPMMQSALDKRRIVALWHQSLKP